MEDASITKMFCRLLADTKYEHLKVHLEIPFPTSHKLLSKLQNDSLNLEDSVLSFTYT